MNKVNIHRILVCGGRDFNNYSLVRDTLDNYCKDNGFIYGPDIIDYTDGTEPFEHWIPKCHIIQGGARGADSLAGKWAVENHQEMTMYFADWEQYGKSAGYVRNRQMLVEGNPDVVIAFPGGKGTKNMIDIARKAGVKVIEVKEV